MALLPVLLLLLVGCSSVLPCARAQSLPAYLNSTLPVSDRVSDLLPRMNLTEKVGQMTQIDTAVCDPSVVQGYLIGSVLNAGGMAPRENASARDWANMIDGFQRAAMRTRLGIPLMYGTDAVHGNNNVYGATIFPHNVGLGATGDAELVYRIARATALEVRAAGMHWAFAPCVAVCRDPRWGRCYESFSEDTVRVEDMTTAVSGLQGNAYPYNGHEESSEPGFPSIGNQTTSVASCAKHFVGDGGTTQGIDENNTVISYRNLVRIHARPYLQAVDQGVATVMISYSSWNGEKMHANRYLISHFLKGVLHFQGFTISDWQGIARITSPPHLNYTLSVLMSINAGIDMVMVPEEYQLFITTLTNLVNIGAISMERINDAVTRILRVKFILGLFENPYSHPDLAGAIGQESHRELAREAVRKSLVLLQNSDVNGTSFLPLPKNASRILVAGAHADDVGLQCGGWTITWQGAAGNNWTIGATTILQGIQNAVSASTQVVYNVNPDRNSVVGEEPFDYAIVVVGEQPYAESSGDNKNLTIPDPGPDIISNVCSLVPCVVVLISGRPLVVEPYLSIAKSLVAAWLPGSEAGSGIADVLFGDYNFVGKTPFTWIHNVTDLPMAFETSNYNPLFGYTYGLSY